MPDLRHLTALAVAAIVATAAPSARQAPPAEIAPVDASELIHGVQNVKVTIDVAGSATPLLDAAALQASIEAKLRKSRLNVVPRADTVLNLSMASFEARNLVYFTLRASLHRVAHVQTGRAPSQRTSPAFVRVWSENLFGSAGRLRVADALDRSAGGLVDRFLVDFLTESAAYRGAPVIDRATTLPGAEDGIRGLTDVAVRFLVAPDFGGAVPQATIKEIVENRLRNGGVPIDPGSSNTLWVELASQKAVDSTFIVVGVSVSRPAVLTHDTRLVRTRGEVWRAEQLVAFRDGAVDEREDVRLAVDMVLASYRRMNDSGGLVSAPRPPERATPVTLTEACSASWQRTVVPARAFENRDTVLREGATWCNCLAPRFLTVGLSKADMDALHVDFVNEQARIREHSTDPSLKQACFNR